MSLEAEPTRRAYEPCEECDGRGEWDRETQYDGWVAMCCPECEGTGKVYVEPSCEPEDYVDDVTLG